MKQLINLTDPGVPVSVKRFILVWKKGKGYEATDLTISIGECIELIVATSYNLKKEDSDGRFFNNIILNEESVVAWDGEELIDILFFEVIKNIQKRIKTAQVFTNQAS